MAAPMEVPNLKCSFSKFIDLPCGCHEVYPEETTAVKIRECVKDISSHLRMYKLLKSGIESEGKLICLRAGLFHVEEHWTVCPQHRYCLGIRWRTTPKCNYPYHSGKSHPSSTRSVGLEMSRVLLQNTGHFVPVGSGICPQCISLFYKLREMNKEQMEDHESIKLLEDTPQEVSLKTNLEVSEKTNQMPLQTFACDAENTENDSQQSFMTENLYQSQTGSQLSNWSTEEEIPKDKLNQFLQYFSNGQISPVKYQCRTPLEQCSDRTQRYFKQKAQEAFQLVTEAIAPGQGMYLAEQILNSNAKIDSQDSATEVENVLLKLYKEASNSTVKTHLLSIIAHKYSKGYLLEKFPVLSKFAIDKARRFSVVGELSPMENNQSVFRHKISLLQMEHALDFFGNPTFHQVIAFGSKSLKLESGEKLDIPCVIRTNLHPSLISMYTKYCEETGFQPLSKSTLYKILNTCAASKQKSLKGLDNVAADGSSGFECLETVVESCAKASEWKEDTKKKLKQSKTYLKTEFKLHLNSQSECADHCLNWALSEETESFQAVCQHDHNHICAHCHLFKTVQANILEAIQESGEKREELEKDFQQSVQQVNAWKSHIVRTVAQDLCRQELLETMEPNQVLIVMDWAMKFLPHLFREKQSEWFGQKGRHWHVSVAIYKDEHGNIKHRTYTHIMDSVKQDYYAVASILEHVLCTIKVQIPGVTEAFLRSDNAACYHSGFLWSILPGISSRSGVKILRYDYSEPQSGKSYCDAKIAHMRLKMRMHVTQKNIISAVDMKTALDSNGGVAGCQSAVVEINTSNQKTFPHKFKKIMQIHNLQYYENGNVKIWKAYKVGQGELIPKERYSDKNISQQGPTNLIVVKDFISPSTVEGTVKSESRSQIPMMSDDKKPESSESPDKEANTVSEDTSSGPGAFCCPEFGCSKVYVTSGNLANHLFLGKHECGAARTESSYDIIKRKWAGICTNLSSLQYIVIKDETDSDVPNENKTEPMGWALKKDKRQSKFTTNVKSYLNEIFHEGQKTGRKASPADVSKSMRTTKSNGILRFSLDEWLQPSQIASYFSRLSLMFRKGKENPDKHQVALISDDDLQNILQSIEESELRTEISSSLSTYSTS